MMKLNSRFAVLMVLGLMALAGCQVLCDPLSYGGGLDTCSYELTLRLQELRNINGQDQLVDVTRLDVRDVDKDLRILVTAVSKGNANPIPLSREPIVEKRAEGTEFVPLSVVLDPAEEVKRSLLLRQNRQAKGVVLRELGPFDFRVTIDVPTALGMLSAEGRGMMFRSPRLRQPQELKYPSNPFGPTKVRGRTNVQVASPFGNKTLLLVTEQYVHGIEDKRWLDTYGPNSTGEVGYYDSAAWDLVQQPLTETTNAQLVLVEGAVLIYQTDLVTFRPDLTLLPLSGPRKSGLSRVDSKIPSNATQLAGCAEDSAVALARPEAVLFFQTNPNPLNRAIVYIGELSFPGTQKPVIATRDISADTKASQEYYAVIADEMGSLTLATLNRLGMLPVGVKSTPLGNAVTVDLTKDRPVTALALADLDSDGLQDIILAMKDGTLWWSPQQPNGTFKLAESLGITVPLESGAFPTRLSVGDVVGDASPDLAVATSENRVFVYKNE